LKRLVSIFLTLICFSGHLISFGQTSNEDSNRPSDLFKVYGKAKYSDPSIALEYLDSLMALKSLLSDKQLAKVHTELALQHTYLMNFDSVQYHSSMALKDTLRDRQSNPAAMAASIMGNLFAERRMADSSYYYHHIALNNTEYRSVDYATYLSNYAVSLTRFHAYSEAEKYYQEAYDIAIELKSNQLIVNCISGLVQTSSNEIGNHTEEHVEMLKGALKYISEPSDTYYLKQNIAVVLSDLGRVEEADSILQAIEEEYPELHKNPNPYRDHTLALLSYRKGKYQKAINILNDLKSGFPNYNRMDEVYLDLSQAYAYLGMPDSSIHYSRLLFELNDEQKSEANAQALKRTEENMELYQMRVDMLSLKNDQQEKDLQLKNLLLLIASLVIVVLVLAGIFYYLNKKRKEEIRQKSEQLSEKNKELTLVGLEVAQKSQWLNSLKKAVNKGADDSEEIRRILKAELVRLNKIEKDWANFLNYFEDLYQGFYSKLRERSKSISTSELRLASLIKLELSNSEIADLLNVSSDSVKSSKYRLKKKLNLSEDQDLAQFISQL